MLCTVAVCLFVKKRSYIFKHYCLLSWKTLSYFLQGKTHRLLRGSLTQHQDSNARYPFLEASNTIKHILRNNICVVVCNILKCSATRKKKNTQQNNKPPTFNLQCCGYFSSSKYHIIVLSDNSTTQPVILNMGVIYRPDFRSSFTKAVPQQRDVRLIDLGTEWQPSPQNRKRERERAIEKKMKNYVIQYS